MANRKYDYSDEMMQSTETAEISNAMAVSAATAEETRRQRLEQRNDTLANEFCSLKPEIARSYNALRGLINKSGAFTTTMVNLMDLLKTALSVRLTEEDMAALQKEIHTIADDAVLQIRKEREKANDEIRRNNQSISMTQATFWCMTALLLILATFFVLVIFANVKLFHSGTLTKITAVYAGLIAFTLATVSFIFYKRKY